MLRNVKDLEGFKIEATDGDLGSVKDFYFDDAAWVLSYLVADTGGWLGREVLISPYSFGLPDFDSRTIPVNITKEQVQHSPVIDTDKPVSRQHETAYLGYYGYPFYWGGTGLWGDGFYPGPMTKDVKFAGSDSAYSESQKIDMDRQVAQEGARIAHQNPHLRSCNAVKGYDIHAADGEIGHVKGFLVDERTWAIQYLIVSTSNWWLGHSVLVAPQWISEVSWLHSNLTTNLNRQQIKDAPVYDPASLLSRGEEERVYRHYGRKDYWSGQSGRAA
jgi:uncharacterized protein YrrD